MIKSLNEEQLAKVRNQIQKMSTRNQALIEFLLSTGCRTSEVTGLNVEDINVKERTAVINRQGVEVRKVYFSPEAAGHLEEYLRNHPENVSALFLNRNDERLSTYSIHRICKALGKKAGLRKNLSPNIFRHTFASRMLVRGVSLESISTFLGPWSTNKTLEYERILTKD